MAGNLEELIAYLRWNNYICVASFTLVFYDYVLLFDKEVTYRLDLQNKRPWTPMIGLYLVVRYFGIILAVIDNLWGGLLYMQKSPCLDIIVFVYWGYTVHYCCVEIILIWRLYAMCGRSKRVLCVLLGLFLPVIALSIGKNIYLYCQSGVFSVEEIITPYAKYCTFTFHIGPMFVAYTYIPVLCYDAFLLIFSFTLFVKHRRERRNISFKPNPYVRMIVQYHIIYFVIHLVNQFSMTMLWANIPMPALQLSVLFSNTAPFVFVPRLVISTWDAHARDTWVDVGTAFTDCIHWTAPPNDSEEHIQTTQDA